MKLIWQFDDSVLPDLEEFKKSFKKTILMYEDTINNTIKPFLCYDISSEKIHGYTSKNDEKIIKTTDPNIRLFIHWPSATYYEIQEEQNKPYQVFWFSRVPKRQWKKAPCEDNTIILQNPYLKDPPQERSLNLNHFIAIQNQKYTKNLQDSFELLSIFPKKSAIINNKMILTNHPDNKNLYILWYMFKPIATFNKRKSNQIEWIDNFFTEESIMETIKNEY